MNASVIFIAVVVALAIGVAVLYNTLVGKRQLTDNGWSDIDVQLKRRADLIPQLVTTVKGYAAHERALFEEIAEKRSAAMAAGDDPKARGAAESALARPLGRVVALAEAYPDLKANQNFLDLQRQLAETEDKIEMARRFYNGAVRELNTLVHTFPSNVVAGALRLQGASLFRDRRWRAGRACDSGVLKAMAIRTLFIAALAAVFAQTANAEEQITNFDVAIDVETDGDILVTETISVASEGYQIQRGIFRDLPRFFLKGARRLPYVYDVISVTRDGEKEPYAIEKEGNAFRIRIGDADVYLADGPHRYALTYEVNNQVRYFDDYDELYWNATGNFWAFPIERARAVVTLPGGAPATQYAAYTGA